MWMGRGSERKLIAMMITRAWGGEGGRWGGWVVKVVTKVLEVKWVFAWECGSVEGWPIFVPGNNRILQRRFCIVKIGAPSKKPTTALFQI